MRKLFLIMIFGIVPKITLAAQIDLSSGGSVTIGRQRVTCNGQNQVRTNVYTCDCWDNGRTDNPPPIKIEVEAGSATEAMINGKQVCANINYGNPNFGYSPVSNCRYKYSR